LVAETPEVCVTPSSDDLEPGAALLLLWFSQRQGDVSFSFTTEQWTCLRLDYFSNHFSRYSTVGQGSKKEKFNSKVKCNKGSGED
jgi:hypothetical protein